MSEQELETKTSHPTDPNRWADGTLKAGHAATNKGQGGRRRIKYLVATEDAISAEEWRAVVVQAKFDALGLKRAGGKIIADDNSNGIVRNLARTWLAKVVGIDRLNTRLDENDGGDIWSEFDNLSDTDIDGALAVIRRARSAANRGANPDDVAGLQELAQDSGAISP